MFNYINRLPIDVLTTEARCRVHIVTDPRKLSAACDILDELLGHAGYPILEIEMLSNTETQVEVAALLDGVLAALEKAAPVYSATWSVSTTP